MKDGTYVLTETVAPNGYAMHSGTITFMLSGGTVTVTNSDASGIVGTGASSTEDATTKAITLTFTIENTAGTELPSTGQPFGLSRMGFASLGTVLLSAFVVLYYYKKKQRYYAELNEDDV